MIASWKAAAALILLAGVLSIAWTINHYRNNAITNNVITAMNLIRDISQATQNAKNELAEKGETRIVYIKQALEGDSYANQLVPSAAADSLREYADILRPGSGGADKR